jgi:nitrite reductase/ring-hydroxylating ferredoxin subunit
MPAAAQQHKHLPAVPFVAIVSAMTSLHLAGTYLRDVAASIARIRENVLDWEHLPALHASSFAACDLVDEDADGWRVRLTAAGGGPAQTLKLWLAPDTSQYRVLTEDGPGASSEIRVSVTETAPHAAHVRVEYHVPVSDPEVLAMIGTAFVAIYEQLWDEDEAMMQAREAALAPRPRAPDTIDLGPEAGLALPLDFDLGSGRFRLIRHDGALLAHSRICPHWLGPLDTPPDANGCLTCPWHGYRFDALTGHSADGRALRLAPPPTIRIEAGRVIAATPKRALAAL